MLACTHAEAERRHAEELRIAKEAAVPRAATPEPVMRAKTPPPPVPIGRSLSRVDDGSGKSGDDGGGDDDGTTQSKAKTQSPTAPKSSPKATPPIPGGSKATKVPSVPVPKVR